MYAIRSGDEVTVATKKSRIVNKYKTAVKKSKYIKIFIEKWKCGECSFQWTYKTMKCPLCACFGVAKTL